MTFVYALGITAIFCIVGIIWTEIQLNKTDGTE